MEYLRFDGGKNTRKRRTSANDEDMGLRLAEWDSDLPQEDDSALGCGAISWPCMSGFV
jgi:hypothetical protein